MYVHYEITSMNVREMIKSQNDHKIGDEFIYSSFQLRFWSTVFTGEYAWGLGMGRQQLSRLAVFTALLGDVEGNEFLSLVLYYTCT